MQQLQGVYVANAPGDDAEVLVSGTSSRGWHDRPGLHADPCLSPSPDKREEAQFASSPWFMHQPEQHLPMSPSSPLDCGASPIIPTRLDGSPLQAIPKSNIVRGNPTKRARASSTPPSSPAQIQVHLQRCGKQKTV